MSVDELEHRLKDLDVVAVKVVPTDGIDPNEVIPAAIGDILAINSA